MGGVIKAGLLLVVLVAALSLGIALSGLHESSPLAAQFAFVIPAILLNVGCVFWGLRMTAAQAGYGGQVLNGLLIGVVAGVLIFAFSFLMLTVLLPDHLAEVKAATIEWAQASSLPEETKAKQIESVEKTTALSQALAGLVGTAATSLIAAAVIAIRVRRR
jgi:hypothetical protein